jgi:signal transduction histidine kinase
MPARLPERLAIGRRHDFAIQVTPLALPRFWSASFQERLMPPMPEEMHTSSLPRSKLAPDRVGDEKDLGAPEITRSSRALRALAALSGSLTDALGPREAADLVEQKALSALGATSAIVVTLGPFPPQPTSPSPATALAQTTLHVVQAIGLPAEVRAALDELPLDAPVPFADVARTGQPLFLQSEQALGHYPDWGAAMIRAGARAAAIVPVWANGELRGVLGLAWPQPQTFDEDARAFVLTLGVMCAQAIMRAHLRDAELLARESAEQANRSKAQFVATIGHELRTPMNAILGYAELLRDGVDGAVTSLQHDHLARVHASGRYLLDLIEDLLGYARLEAAEDVVRPETAELANLVSESVALVRGVAERKGLRVVVIPAPPIALHTDARKVGQIIVNLLANAVKFTESGDVTLLTRTLGNDADLGVSIEVTDTGRGISPADHQHVFEPFWRSDPISRNSEGSTGLGLSVARQFARLLGGDLVVSWSGLGAGSAFTATFPARYVAPPATV